MGAYRYNYLPHITMRAFTDPDTGRAPLNVNTCFNSGELDSGPPHSNSGQKLQFLIEEVFNVGALRRIIKVGSFYVNNYTNPAVKAGIRHLDPYLYVYPKADGSPGVKQSDVFEFDATTHQVKLVDASGTEVFRDAVTGLPPRGSQPKRTVVTTPSVALGSPDPMTIGTPDPVTGVMTTAPGRIRTDPDDSHYPPRDPATAGTVDPVTVSIDAIDGKMSYAITPDPNAAIAEADAGVAAKKAAAETAAAAAIAAPSNSIIVKAADTAKLAYQDAYDTVYAGLSTAGIGRPYTYKSYEDLYAKLNTEEKNQVEILRTKLALQYQETLCRYFTASFANHNNARYPSYDATTVASYNIVQSSGITNPPTTVTATWNGRLNYKNYRNTYLAILGTTEADKVVNYAQKYDYTAPRFPVSVDVFRTNVKNDLRAMVEKNNNIPLYTYAGLKGDTKLGTMDVVYPGCGEFVNFDSTGKPEICPGKMDRRTASAIFDNICPGKRLLFPEEPNIEVKDPIGQLWKQRVGIDEEAVNWMEQTPVLDFPAVVPPVTEYVRSKSLLRSEQLWTPHSNSETAETTVSPPTLLGGVNTARMNNPYYYFLYKEDVNENGILDGGVPEDIDRDGHLDVDEDINNNGIRNLPSEPDVDLDNRLDLVNEDTNGNGRLDYGEDLNGNTVLTKFETWCYYPDGFGLYAYEPNDTTWGYHIYNMREKGQEVRTANPYSPVKGRDSLTTTGGMPTADGNIDQTHIDRFIDENVYFNTAENPINAAFDANHPNCIVHPLPSAGTLVKNSNGDMVPIVQDVLLSNFNKNGNDNINGNRALRDKWISATDPTLYTKFDTIEYIPGHVPVAGGPDLSTPVDLNGDAKINTYYRTPERQLLFSSDCFSRELTTTSVAYKIIATVQLCDAASVELNPTSPVVVGHTEINAMIQLAPDIEGSDAKETASEYNDANPNPKQRDPGLHYYRNNQPTVRKTHRFAPMSDAEPGTIFTYNNDTSDPTKIGTRETYDPVKEALGLQIRGGTLYENSMKSMTQYAMEDRDGSTGIGSPGGITEDRNGNGVLDRERTTSSAQWVDPLGVPDDVRDANLITKGIIPAGTVSRNSFYCDNPMIKRCQNSRRFVIRELINLGAPQ
jgi:hypothetical protein